MSEELDAFDDGHDDDWRCEGDEPAESGPPLRAQQVRDELVDEWDGFARSSHTVLIAMAREAHTWSLERIASRAGCEDAWVGATALFFPDESVLWVEQPQRCANSRGTDGAPGNSLEPPACIAPPWRAGSVGMWAVWCELKGAR